MNFLNDLISNKNIFKHNMILGNDATGIYTESDITNLFTYTNPTHLINTLNIMIANKEITSENANKYKHNQKEYNTFIIETLLKQVFTQTPTKKRILLKSEKSLKSLHLLKLLINCSLRHDNKAVVGLIFKNTNKKNIQDVLKLLKRLEAIVADSLKKDNFKNIKIAERMYRNYIGGLRAQKAI